MQVREETSHVDHQTNSGEPFFCLITFSAISMTLLLLLLSVVYLFFYQINRLCGVKILSRKFMLPLLVSLISWLRSLIVHWPLYDFTHSNLMVVLDQPSTESSLQLPEKRILELILDILQRWVLFPFYCNILHNELCVSKTATIQKTVEYSFDEFILTMNYLWLYLYFT